MALTLQELLNWPPEIGDLAKATHDVATNHADSAEFLRSAMHAVDWDGESGDTARQAVFSTAGDHDKQAERIKSAAGLIDTAHQEADALANKVKDILNYAAEAPAVKVNPATDEVSPPDSYQYMDAETQTKVSEKIAELKAKIADAIIEGDRIDDELAKAIAKASGLPEPAPTATSLEDLMLGPPGGPLRPGEARNHGPVAGTGSDPGIPGIGAADLGEVVTLPNGKQVAIFGDAFEGDHVGADPHYRSVAVPVSFDSEGRPHYGPPLTGPKGSPNELFSIPQAALDADPATNDTLPGGTVKVGNDTYMMVVGTKNNLEPTGSWLVKVNNDFSKPWEAIPGSWASSSGPDARPTQISGFQSSKDGKVYIAADSFDRTSGVTMYQVDPNNGGSIADRGTWQPWTGAGFGTPTDTPTIVSPDRYGELSFQEVQGHAVLSGFNVHNGPDGAVEVLVGDSPTSVFDNVPTVVVQNGTPQGPNWVPQPYGGFIMPGSTLDNMNILVSQWHQPANAAGVPIGPGIYNSQQVNVNVNQPPR
ncbi:DUF4185 domain-containing protein [Mycobacterium sp. BMJ-28]